MYTQAYFENIKTIILSEIEKAEHEILVAVAWFTDKEIFNKLIEKISQNVNVEVIIANDAINKNSIIDFDLLNKKGGKFWYADKKDGSLMHNKFCIIDSQTVISGSYNWTYKASMNQESITLIKDCFELTQEFIQQFKLLKKEIAGIDENEKQFDFNKFCLRLDAIKNLLIINELDDVKQQINKITFNSNSAENKEIYEWILKLKELIKNNEFSKTIEEINNYINKHRAIQVFIDYEIYAIKLEVSVLEIQISTLENEKAETERIIHIFQVQYNRRLGEIIIKILELKKVIYKNKKTRNDKEYEQAEKDYNEFKGYYDKTKKEKIRVLNEEELIEIKAVFKKAAKLCHPDMVKDIYVDQARKVFIDLKDAYDNNDIDSVREILTNLELGLFISKSEKVDGKQELLKLAKQLRMRRNILEKEISEAKKSEIYISIQSIGDWNKYFNEQENELNNEFEELKKQL